MNNSINGQASIFNADLTNDELDDAQLEAISGGVSCKAKYAIAEGYYSLANFMDSYGFSSLTEHFHNMGGVIANTGCGD